MNEQILKKIKELYDLIQLEQLPDDRCIITGEYSIETNIIGNENAYLRLIASFSELLLFSKQIIPKNDDYEEDKIGLWTSEIKRYLDEYSEFNIVASVLQKDAQFAETVQKNFDDFQNRNV